MAEAQGAMTHLATPPKGTLRLLVNLYFARTLLLPHLAAFRQRFPKLKLHIEVAERYPDFDKEQFDIILGYALTPRIPQQMVGHLITTTERLLCASPDYLKHYGNPKNIQQLKQHQFIRHTFHFPYNKLFFRDGSDVEIPQSWLLVNSNDALLEATSAGLGIAQYNSFPIQDLLGSGRLVRLLPEYPMEKASIYLFYHYSRYQQPKIKQFIDFIDELFGK